MAKRIQVGGRIESKEVGGIVTGAAEILDDAKGKKQSIINEETDDELLRLDQSKQDNLTFDNAPTEGSDNPVKSGGVYAAQQAILLAIAAINELIPSAASTLNQLADKAFVNSSISTNTATFRGTSAAGLNEQQFLAWANGLEHDLNDYVFWQTSDAAGNTLFKRYKWNGMEWVYEYTLNNSTFTVEQWEAIQSGITALLVAKLRALPTAQELIQSFDSKQDVLTFDDVPTLGSTNPVKSSGIYNVIKAITDLIPAEATAQNQLADKADVAAKIVAAIPSWKGQYDALIDLQAVTGAKAGDMGCVKTMDSDGHAVLTFYQYSAQGAWVVYYTLRHYAQNKPATTGTTGDYPYNGMGRIELQKNIVNGVNTLTQAMLTQQNTIYVIQYDFTLGEDITVPANCVLEFNGGSISGNSIDNVYIINNSNKSVFNNVVVTNIKNKEIHSCWWSWSVLENNSNILQAIFDSIHANNGGTFVVYSIITYYTTLIIKTQSNAVSYDGNIIKVIGFSNSNAGLRHDGNSDAIQVVGLEGETETSARQFILENIAVWNNTTDTQERYCGINIKNRGCKWFLRNVIIQTTLTQGANNYGIYCPSAWVYNIEDCTIYSNYGIYINDGTSCYIRNVYLHCHTKGLSLSGGYCVIENVFGDGATGTMFEFRFLTANIISVGAESPDVDCLFSINSSTLIIGLIDVVKPTADSGKIFITNGSRVKVNLCKIHDSSNVAHGWLAEMNTDTYLIIEHLVTDTKFTHDNFDEFKYNTIIVRQDYTLTAMHGVDGSVGTEYSDWYMETPKYRRTTIGQGYYDWYGDIDCNAQGWRDGQSVGAIQINAYPDRDFSPFAWVKVSGLGTRQRDAQYKTVPYINIKAANSTLPNANDGVSVFHGSRLAYWIDKWRGADGRTYGSLQGNTRPTLDANDIGYSFFDTSLTPNRPIWWNGSSWVDEEGYGLSTSVYKRSKSGFASYYITIELENISKGAIIFAVTTHGLSLCGLTSTSVTDSSISIQNVTGNSIKIGRDYGGGRDVFTSIIVISASPVVNITNSDS